MWATMPEQSETPESATDAATLSDDERRKVRQLLRACSPESVELALSILDTLDATTADWEATFDREISTFLVQSWNTAVWNSVYGRLPARRRDLFAALAVTRFVTATHAWNREEKLDAVWYWARAWSSAPHAGLREIFRMQSPGGPDLFRQEFPWVTLSFLSDLDDEIVAVIANFTGDVHLDGITRLTADQARGLARHQGWLYCNSITEISADVANELVKHPSHVFLEGLTELSHVGLAEKLASKPIVYLDNVVSVSDAAVQALARSGARVFAHAISDKLVAIKV
jgi:hypothetical protein